jgi:flavin reductase (DIM6/NTAB) family NADH-FMN oxidoreductase RutF
MKKTPLLNKKLLDSPSTFLNPVPVVMVSCCGTSIGFDKPNIITVGWVGTVNSEPPMLSISVRKSRHSHRQIMESGEFVVNLVTESLLEACDLCGVKSGRDIDKFSACHLIPEKSGDILKSTPAIQNSPVSLFCKVIKVIELPSHDLFIGEIIAVTVSEDLYEASGKINLEKARLVVFSHGEYWSLQEVLGFFGYSVASSGVKARRMPKKGLVKETKIRRQPGKGRR